MSLAPLSMVYRSEKQLPHLFQNLQGFYRTGDFCDVVLNVGPCRISAHGVILAAFSPYLCSLLQGDLDSRRRTELSLQNIDHIGLRCLIDYCYSGVITVDSSSADKILGVAKTLQVKEIEKLCLTFLTAQQNFSSELAYDAVKQGSNLTNTPQSRGSSCTKVESSGRYSPRTSPNVSTSGQPSSETGSTGHPDSDIVTIKVEAPEHLNTENEHQAYNRGRMLYVDIADDGSILERRRQINPSSGPGVIDMTKMSPTLLTSPLYPISSMMIPTAPPSLQLMSPRQEREGKSSVSRYRDDRLVKDLIPSSGRLETRTVDVEEPTDLSPQAVTGLMIPGVENTETDQQVLTCSVCHSMFSSSEALKLHMLLHQQTLTQTPETLIHHQLQVQKNEEPHELQIPHVSRGKNSRGEHSNETVSNFYRCSTCGKAFRDAQSLKFHRYNHVLRHSCNLCGKRFSRSWNLHRHRKTHFRMANWPLRADMRMNESLGSEETDADPNSSGDLMDLTGNDEETETGNNLVEHSVEEQETEEDTVVELLSGDGSDCQ